MPRTDTTRALWDRQDRHKGDRARLFTALARLDPRYALTGVVETDGTDYRIVTEAPERFMIPRRAGDITAAMIRANGKGVSYTETPFAYLFTRVA